MQHARLARAERWGNPMRIVEIRDLDGPNLFLRTPAIKVEIGDVSAEEQDDVIASLEGTIRKLHEDTNVTIPEMTSMVMETPGHIVVAFEWHRREYARKLGRIAANSVIGEDVDEVTAIEQLRASLDIDPDEDDYPLLVRPSENRARIVSITGTNGKTTTSRLIDFVLRHVGFRVGLTSSAGVYIDNEQVLEGDYSGPSGARRVLEDPDVEFAVLETARGGLLLRGAGYEAADVAVITNVTEDHLGIHGILTVDGLAAVKAIVARNVSASGFCILNANNEYTLKMRDVTPGIPVLIGRDADSEVISSHVASGGSAISVDADKNVVWFHAGEEQIVTNLSAIPMTFDGKAPHQVENALAAIGALIGLGIPLVQIREGVAAFTSTAENSKGRLNVFEINDGTVIIDFAHNEAGLVNLLSFARNYLNEGGRLIAVIGTAGDRDNHSLHAITRAAMKSADVVVLKDSVHYLRGREPGEMIREMRSATAEVSRPKVELRESPDERSATFMMVEELQPGDVIAVMCVEDYDYILRELSKIGEVVA